MPTWYKIAEEVSPVPIEVLVFAVVLIAIGYIIEYLGAGALAEAIEKLIVQFLPRMVVA